MVLDQCISSTADYSQAEAAMNLTHRWAKRSMVARGDSPQSLFGIVQGAFSATMMVLCAMAFGPKPLPEMVMQSRYAPHLLDAANLVAQLAPDEVKEGFDRARRDLDKVLPEKLKEHVGKLSSSTL